MACCIDLDVSGCQLFVDRLTSLAGPQVSVASPQPTRVTEVRTDDNPSLVDAVVNAVLKVDGSGDGRQELTGSGVAGE